MKKYKLIKEYPGSPKLGTIVKDRNGSLYFPETDSVESSSKGNLFKEIVINNPEFWQEVVEKDYEILSFYAKNISGKGDDFVDKEYIWYETSKGNGKWSRKGHITAPYNTQEINNHNGYGIHSIRRLSDGEIFTVGDKVDSTISDLGRATDLTGFKIIDNKLKVGLRNLGYYPLLTIILPKKPLFTTEDGVDIYEGDTYFEANLTYGVKSWTSEYPVYFNKDVSKRIFSTKEKAEEYILMNKPCLSILDVLKLKNKWSIKTIDKLKELVKNK